MSVIKQVQVDNTTYDLDNRFISISSTSGTLTTDQWLLLQASSKNYIKYSNTGLTSITLYIRVGDNGTQIPAKLYYASIDSSGKATKWCTVTNNTSSITYSISTTCPNIASTNSTSKLYLIGGTSQSGTGVQTYSNSSVYEQAGTLYADQLTVTNGPTNNMDVATKQYVDNAIGDAIMASY